jgi:hypothetical protein
MKSPPYSPALAEQKFSRLLPAATLDDLARASGFCQRAARRCRPVHFVLAFFTALSKNLYSLSGWAAQLSVLSGATLARQSLDERLNARSSRFALRLLGYLLGLRSQVGSGLRRTLGAFASVLVQDSTTVPLHDGLQGEFKGNCSHGQPKALLRVKAIVDLRSLQVLHLGICSYAENDQVAASNIHPLVRRGTLVLRDRATGAWTRWARLRQEGPFSSPACATA